MLQTASSDRSHSLESLTDQPGLDPWVSAESELQNDSDNWLLGYVDVLTLMLTLVVLLLAFQKIESSPESRVENEAARENIIAPESLPEKRETGRQTASEAQTEIQEGTHSKSENLWSDPATVLTEFNTKAVENAIRTTQVQEDSRDWISILEPAQPTLQNSLMENLDSIETAVMEIPNAQTLIVTDSMDLLNGNLLNPDRNKPDAGTTQMHDDLMESSLRNYRKLISDTGMSGFIDITSSHNAIRMEVNENILFETGHADLKQQGNLLLQELATVFQNQAGEIYVEGHTDNVPISNSRFPSNWELSSSRASSVARQLIELNINPRRIRTIGFADTRPRSNNETPQGRSDNRRVSLIVALEETAVE